MDGWRDPLEGATVALDLLDGSGGGTGFVLTPGTVVTCAHVVAGAATLRGRIVATGTELTLTLSEDSLHRAANGLDIAFLRFEADAPAPTYVLTAPHTAFGDRLWVYGHPRGDYRAGQWAALEYQGDSRLAFDDPMPMPRGYGTPVGEGFSGSPVVNQRTGAVCGMLARSNKAGSAHMVPVSRSLTDSPPLHCPCPGSAFSPTTSCGLAATAIPAPGCATTSLPLGTPRTSIRTPRSSLTRRRFRCPPSTSARRRRPPTRRRWTRLPRTATVAGAGHGRAPRAFFRTTAMCCSPAGPEQASRASCGGWPTPGPLLGWTTRHGRRRTYPYAWRPRTPRPPLPRGTGPGGRP